MEGILDLTRIAKCSQMSNPKTGQGSGGDRCTEACAAMIDATYKIGTKAQAGDSPEVLMNDFTEWLNQGKDVSALENPEWIGQWLASHSKTIHLEEVAPDHQHIAEAIAAGHLVMLNVGDYRQLRTFDNRNPYQWDVSKAAPSAHVVLVAGWRDQYGSGPTLVLYDPLQSLAGMPWDYSEASIREAGAARMWEVVGPSLAKPTPKVPEQTHRVVMGDTLWGLAQHYYGDGKLFSVIAAANSISNPDEILVNSVLKIPAR